MSCVRPDRLADFAQRRLGARAMSAVEAHLGGCAQCRTALGRVTGAQEILRQAADAPVPDVGGVRTEATIRWSRIRPRPAARPIFFGALGLAAGAAALLFYLQRPPRAAVATLAPHAPSPSKVEPARLQAVVTLLGGPVTLTRAGQIAPLMASSLLDMGDRIATGAGGRFAAQWGEGSGVLLAADSELAFSELRPARQQLGLRRGKVDVRVGPHQPGESLQVLAPGYAVTVKGTWFTVAADGARTTVEVFEGVVEVTERDGGATTLLRAPATATFFRGRAETAVLDAQRAAALRARSELNLMPWSGAEAALAASGLLRVASDPDGALAVDGVELGQTPLQVRRPLGRHYVEIARRGFQPLRRWVQVGAEPGELRLALLHVPAVPEAASGPVSIEAMVHERARQIRGCYEHSLKRDPTLAGTISLRLRVGDAGQVTQVVVEQSTLGDAQVGECLRHEAAGWSFKTGRNATVVYPFVFRPQ